MRRVVMFVGPGRPSGDEDAGSRSLEIAEPGGVSQEGARVEAEDVAPADEVAPLVGLDG